MRRSGTGGERRGVWRRHLWFPGGFLLTSLIGVSEPSAKVIGEWGQIRTWKSTRDYILALVCCVCECVCVGVFKQSVNLTSLTDKDTKNSGKPLPQRLEWAIRKAVASTVTYELTSLYGHGWDLWLGSLALLQSAAGEQSNRPHTHALHTNVAFLQLASSFQLSAEPDRSRFTYSLMAVCPLHFISYLSDSAGLKSVPSPAAVIKGQLGSAI